MKTTSIPARTPEARSFADHLDDIRSRQQSVVSAIRALLTRQGWRRTRMNPAHLWLWSKKLADGRTILTDLNTALAIECALAHQPPLGPSPRPASQPLYIPSSRN